MGIATDEERRELVEVVRINVIDNAKSLIAATQHLNCPIESTENRETAKSIISSLTTSDLEDPSWATKIYALWQDKGVQKAYASRENFQLYDSTE